MKLNKPRFWDKEKIGFFPILLFPLTLIFLIIIFFKKNFSRSKKFDIPVICVGNIYLGGTGKTPSSIFLAVELKNLGYKPAIIRKYYEDHKDEHNLIKHSFTDLILSNNRENGIREAEKRGYDIAILDDGLQDYKIKKKLSIVCFNQKQLVGNGQVLPSGRWESFSALKNVDLILINGIKFPTLKKDFENEQKLKNLLFSLWTYQYWTI